MDIKNEVLYRVYFLLFGVVIPISLLLIYQTGVIAFVEGPQWRARAKTENIIEERELEAERGSILASDGSLLATSVPIFDIYFDPFAPTAEDYLKHVDSLAYCLATYVDQSYTVGGFRDYLDRLRDSTYNRSRHILLKSRVSFAEKRTIEQFPLFNLGQFRGGLIAEKRSERKRPFGLLARRTIGYVRDDAMPIGLEGRFDKELGGKPGKQWMICVDRREDLWKPIEDLTAVEPQIGDDVVTTLDINIQDITEEALLRAMQDHDAEWGTAVVMEVNTGKIRAIANIGKGSNGWVEDYNYAIASATEPGSTFKLASIMALLEDDYVSLEDTIHLEQGRTEYYDAVMEDSSPHSRDQDSTTVRTAFEISSNVGISKLVNKHYGEDGQDGAERFVERLRQFNLHLPTGVEIDGESQPYIKEAYSQDDSWSGTTLPWMSIGYELKITPLQLLTFYNAVANDGRLMKPMLVSEIRRFGETIQEIRPVMVKRRIASKSTISKARSLLEGVVERGTAYKLRTDRYHFAGKTGTAQIDYRRGSRGTRVGGYQASFAGYFPAENPKYSCIVVINKPRQGGYYGSDVAGPVFREIADKCYYSMIDLHEAMNSRPQPDWTNRLLPSNNVGEKADLRSVLTFLDIPWYGKPETDLVALQAEGDSLIMYRRILSDNLVPNVVGMGLRDALYVLENRGLAVRCNGVGKIVRQSLVPGTRARGQTIWITLE